MHLVRKVCSVICCLDRSILNMFAQDALNSLEASFMQHFFECMCVIGLSQVTTIIYPCIFNREQQQDNKSVT